MILHEQKDMWASGATYESYVGRWSRLVAGQFLTWLDVLSGAQWLDVGCGTGALSQTILDTASPHAVLGIDSSEQMVVPPIIGGEEKIWRVSIYLCKLRFAVNK
jgi:2-polyprenyl-3-methyl-5-hydroxy-6-metoxy-1,4-benzoquinol methylase